MSFWEWRKDRRREIAELHRSAPDAERAALIRAIQLMESLMSKQLDDLTTAVTALSAAVNALLAKAGVPVPPDESAPLEAIAVQMQGLVTQINAVLNPPAPSPAPGP